MKVIITGGHFSPAYSVIRQLGDDCKITLIGRKYAFEGDTNETFEYKICKKENINFIELIAGRFQRKFTKHSIPAALKFPKGIYDATKILRAEKPDVVVTFGGYVGLPVALAASMLHIPVILHEQTQSAGLSAKLISKVAEVICVSFESSKVHFKGKKVVLTGNPIRSEILQEQKINITTSKQIIYITGGSTGSHAINEAIYQILPELLKEYVIIHQVGNSKETNDIGKFNDFRNQLSGQDQENYIVAEFFTPSNVAAYFQHAALVVSRSGINTVLELMATGAVSLLIPLPFGQLDEQLKNALLFQRTGLAEVMLQEDMNPDLLLSKMHAMIKEQKKYKENAKNALKYVHIDAAEKIVQQIYLYGERGTKGSASQEEKKSISI